MDLPPFFANRPFIFLPDRRLTTAEILYHLPDYPSFLQTYVWQDYDAAPDFPVLLRFLTFWQEHLIARLHSVNVAQRRVLIPSDSLRTIDTLLTIH